MLQARGLRRTYGDLVALDGLDLLVETGCVYALLGPNGAGKTTTVNLFLGFERPSAGEALVDGVVVADDPLGARARIAYVPDQVRLFPRFSGLENLAYLARLATGRRLARAELDALLDRVGLAREARERRVGTYSKGMRQRVGIAAALAKDARALLLDEPTSGLDPRASSEFGALVREVADGGVAVLMATHDVFRSAGSGDRIGVLRSGRLVLEVDGCDVGPGELEHLYLEAVYEAGDGDPVGAR